MRPEAQLALARIAVAVNHINQAARELEDQIVLLESEGEKIEVELPLVQRRLDPEHEALESRADNPYSFMSQYANGKALCSECGEWFSLTRGGFVQHVVANHLI